MQEGTFTSEEFWAAVQSVKKRYATEAARANNRIKAINDLLVANKRLKGAMKKKIEENEQLKKLLRDTVPGILDGWIEQQKRERMARRPKRAKTQAQ